MESGNQELAEVIVQDASQGLEAVIFPQSVGTQDLFTRNVELLQLESPRLTYTVVAGLDAGELQSAGNAANAQMA